MDVVCNDKELVCARVGTGDGITDSVLGVLDLVWRDVVVVVGVEIEIYSMVSECRDGGYARGIAAAVGWPEIGWEEAENVAECHFQLDDFLALLGFGEK